MGRNVNAVPMPDYPDIVPIHPNLTIEDIDRQIEEEIEKSKQYTEWPDV